jgi:carboxyl-terminal processing protease
MKFKGRFLIVAVLILIIGTLAGGRFKRPAQATLSNEVLNHDLIRSFVDAVQVIEEHYVAELDKEQLTRGAVLGMLRTLDPHSSFFDRREFNEMQDEQSSKFYGIGVTINERNGRIYILNVSKGMPAERAGLRYGDAIVAVDGQPTKNWRQSDVLKHVRGERGSVVEITVERIGQAQPVTVRAVRDEVPYPSVRNYFMLRSGIGYIGLTGGFNQTSSEELRTAIAKLKLQGMTALILDLRRNPGGLLKQAIQVAEEFLPLNAEIVSVRGREGRFQKQVYKSENSEPETLPLVVLINRESASASEIVAGAIQDQDRGLIVGEDSFGKGLVQTVFRLPGGTGLTLTTAKYYTPSGRSIQREYNGVSFYDYYSARRHTQSETNPETKHQNNTVFTPTGRQLHGGGGITPDIVVKEEVEDMRLRDACFEFARRLVAGVVPGLEQYQVTKITYNYHWRGNEYPLTEQVLSAFRAFLREHPELHVTESQVNSHLDYVRRRIRAEVITAAYGIEVAERFLLESDLQALRAIEAIPQAKHLRDTARLFTPSAKN